MLVLRTPKGWTGPKEVDGLPVEGTWRAHQVPLAGRPREPRAPAAPRGLAAQLPAGGALRRARAGSCPSCAELAAARRAADEREPARQRRRAAARPRAARLPRLRGRGRAARHDVQRGDARARRLPARRRRRQPGRTSASSAPTRRPRTGSTPSSRRRARPWEAEIEPTDEHLAPTGRVDGGALRAPLPGLARGLPAHGPARPLQLLRGVHPHRRLDVQPAREVAEGDPRRSRGGDPIASLNYLLSSHVWRQDHNGFSHQDPGFIDHVVNKKAEVIRVYLPPDANTPALGRRPLPAQPRLRERDRRRQAARARTTSRWTRRSSTARAEPASGTGPRTTRTATPDVVLGCCGDVPTLETLAAAALLREHLPELGCAS